MKLQLELVTLEQIETVEHIPIERKANENYSYSDSRRKKRQREQNVFCCLLCYNLHLSCINCV